jgi:hypothetical protein
MGLTEPAGFAQAVEIAARADFDAISAVSDPPFCRWDQLMEDERDEWRRQMRVVLSALLAARMETPCPTCHGETVLYAIGEPAIDCPNPDCHEGMVTTDLPLIVMGGELLLTRLVRDTPKFTLAPSVAARLTKEPEDG